MVATIIVIIITTDVIIARIIGLRVAIATYNYDHIHEHDDAHRNGSSNTTYIVMLTILAVGRYLGSVLAIRPTPRPPREVRSPIHGPEDATAAYAGGVDPQGD